VENKKTKFIISGVVVGLVIIALAVVLLWQRDDDTTPAQPQATGQPSATTEGTTQAQPTLPADDSWLVIFEGQAMDATDFMFFFHNATMFLAEDADRAPAREMAIEELIRSLTILHHAEKAGMALTAEQREQLLPEAELHRDLVGMDFITAERLVDFFSIWHLQGLLAEHHIDYTPCPDEFSQALVEYFIFQGHQYGSFTMLYAVVDNVDDALLAFADDRPFQDVIQQYCIIFPEFGVEPWDARDMIQTLEVDPEDEMIILNMENGHRHILHLDEIFLVLYMYNRTEPDLAIMEESALQQYTQLRVHELFTETLAGWINEADFVINQALLDTF